MNTPPINNSVSQASHSYSSPDQETLYKIRYYNYRMKYFDDFQETLKKIDPSSSRLHTIVQKFHRSHLPKVKGVKFHLSDSSLTSAQNSSSVAIFYQRWMPDATLFKSFSERLAQLFVVISGEMRKKLEEPEKKMIRHRFKSKVEKVSKVKRIGSKLKKKR